MYNSNWQSEILPPQSGAKLLGSIGGAALPNDEKGILSGNFFGSSYTCRATLKVSFYVSLLLLLFAAAKYYVVFGK